MPKRNGRTRMMWVPQVFRIRWLTGLRYLPLGVFVMLTVCIIVPEIEPAATCRNIIAAENSFHEERYA